MPLKVTSRKGVLWIEGMLLGVRVRRSTKLPVGYEREAEKQRLAIEQGIIEGRKGEWRTRPFREAVDAYLQWRKAEHRWSPQMEAVAQKFSKMFDGKKLGELTTETISKTALAEFDGVAPNTLARYLTVLAAILNMAVHRWGMVPVKVQRPRVNDARDVHLDEGQVASLLGWVKANEPRLLPHFVVLIDTGVRLGEAMRLTRASFDEAAGVVRINRPIGRVGKTITRNVPMTDNVRAVLPFLSPVGQALRSPGGTEWSARYAAVKLGRTLAKACLELGIGPIRVHDLRHTFAWLTAKAGADLGDLQMLMGHTDLAMTMRYRGFVASRAAAAVMSARKAVVV